MYADTYVRNTHAMPYLSLHYITLHWMHNIHLSFIHRTDLIFIYYSLIYLFIYICVCVLPPPTSNQDREAACNCVFALRVQGTQNFQVVALGNAVATCHHQALLGVPNATPQFCKNARQILVILVTLQ